MNNPSLSTHSGTVAAPSELQMPVQKVNLSASQAGEPWPGAFPGSQYSVMPEPDGSPDTSQDSIPETNQHRVATRASQRQKNRPCPPPPNQYVVASGKKRGRPPKSAASAKGSGRGAKPTAASVAAEDDFGGKDDEQLRREARHREKNRIAAQKCRARRQKSTSQLHARYEALEGLNRELSSTMADLAAEVHVLKSMVMDQGGCDCDLIQKYIQNAASNLLKDRSGGGNQMQTMPQMLPPARNQAVGIAVAGTSG